MKTHSFKSHIPEEMRRLSNQGHLLEGALLAVVGVLAILSDTGVADWAATVWPIALIIIGALFMTHTQHGHGDAVHQAVLRHRILGITIIAAGLLRLLEIVVRSDVSALLWLIAAFQLVICREPGQRLRQ